MRILRVVILAFLIGMLIASCSNPNMHKLIAVWGYDNVEELIIDGFELFIIMNYLKLIKVKENINSIMK